MRPKLTLFVFVVALLSLFMSLPLLLAQEPTSRSIRSVDGSIVENHLNPGGFVTDMFTRHGSSPKNASRMAGAATITEYSLPISPTNLQIDQMGQVWFSSFDDNAIGSLNVATRQVSVYSRTNDSGGVWAIQQDAIGNIWYATQNAEPNEIVGKYEPTANTFVEWPISGVDQGHYGLALDPNTGDVWFATYWFSTQTDVAGIYRLSPSDNQVSAWSTRPYVEAYDLAIGPGGRIWLTVQSAQPGKQGVIRLDPTTNEMTTWEMPVAGSRPFRLVTAPTGEIWLTEAAPIANSVAQLQPATNTLYEFHIPLSNSFPAGLLKDDHKIWFAAYGANSIGELDLLVASPTTTTVLSPITLPATRTTTTILPNSYVAITRTEASMVTVTSVTPTVIGAFTINPLPIMDSSPFGIALEASQTQVWFAETAGRIGSIKTEVHKTVYFPLVLKE